MMPGIGSLAPSLSPPLSGLVGRYKASALVGFSQGDQVGTLSDLTGNGHHLTQATAAHKPIYDLNSLSGKPGLYFGTQPLDVDDGNERWMSNSSLPFDLAANTVVLIMDNGYTTSNNGGLRYIHFAYGADATWGVSSLWFETDNNGRAAIVGTGFNEQYINAPGGQQCWPVGPVALMFGAAAGSGFWGWDGVQAGTTSVSGSQTGFRIAKGPDNQTRHQDIRILEILVYDHALSSPDKALVNTYAHGVYGCATARKANNIVCLGDSITAGFNPAGDTSYVGRSYPWKLAQIGSRWRNTNIQNAGSTGMLVSGAGGIDAVKATFLPNAFDATASTNTLLLLAGVNDGRASVASATIYAALLSVGTYAKGLGYRVIVGTLIAESAGSSPAWWLDLNNRIRGTGYAGIVTDGGADVVVDNAAVAGWQYATRDASLYQSDLLHPSIVGYGQLASGFSAAV